MAIPFIAEYVSTTLLEISLGGLVPLAFRTAQFTKQEFFSALFAFDFILWANGLVLRGFHAAYNNPSTLLGLVFSSNMSI